MKTLCVLVHVPAVPYHYLFSKIGHYHKYFNNQLQKKSVERIYKSLFELKKNKNDFKEYIEIKLFLSSYFTRLCPSVFSIIKNIDYQQINWEYVLSESTISKAFIPDLPRNFKDVDYTTIQSIILQGKQFETSNMHFSRDIVLNHLQQDVLKQLEKFKANNNKKLISENQVSWFLQAEHLQWMSHEKDNFIFNSPFANAYDAYINFMNMFSDLKARY